MSDPVVDVAVVGAAGRMGRTLVQACADDSGVELRGAVEVPGSAAVGVDAGVLAGSGECGIVIADGLEGPIGSVDAIIDFTTPESTLANLRLCGRERKQAVVGTTGIGPEQLEEIRDLAAGTGIVLAPNMSMGVNLCFKLLEVAARALGDEVDVEVIEAHHRTKADAPSGTAVRMGEVLANVLGRNLDECAVYGRQGFTGERKRETIGFETVRAGDIVGEHTVLFAGLGERIEITHRASSRMNFARGALRAVRWLRDRPPGLYDMQDVLGLR